VIWFTRIIVVASAFAAGPQTPEELLNMRFGSNWLTPSIETQLIEICSHDRIGCTLEESPLDPFDKQVGAGEGAEDMTYRKLLHLQLNNHPAYSLTANRDTLSIHPATVSHRMNGVSILETMVDVSGLQNTGPRDAAKIVFFRANLGHSNLRDSKLPQALEGSHKITVRDALNNLLKECGKWKGMWTVSKATEFEVNLRCWPPKRVKK